MNVEGKIVNKRFIDLDGLLVQFFLKDGNVVVDLGAMFLSHTLGYPNNVATLLLFELQIRVKYAKVKLLHKSVHIQHK